MAGLLDSERARTALQWLLLVAVAALATWHAHDLGWIPPGPLADEPEMGPGSDWDWQYEILLVSDAYAARGETPEWDPFAQFGDPLQANPQAPFRHPAFSMGQAAGGFVTGLSWLYAWCVFSLFVGLGALAWTLGISPLAGLLTGLLVVASQEWVGRLTGGHLWILGISTWPGALAAAHAALDEGRSRRARWVLAALAGAIVGSCTPMGSHYGAPMGLLLVTFLIWAREQQPRLVLGLLAVLWLPVLVQQAPAGGRVIFELAAFSLFGYGLFARPASRQRWLVLAGVAVGVFLTAAPQGVESAWLLAPDGRLTPWSWTAQNSWIEPLSWEALSNRGSMDGYLPLGSPWWWLAAFVGCALLAPRHPAMAALALGSVAIAWSSGRPLKPSLFLTAIPGTAAMAEHTRFQVVLLLLPALGYVEMLRALAERVREGSGVIVATFGSVLVLAALHGSGPEGFEPREPPVHTLADAAAWGQVEAATNDATHYLSRQPALGRTHPVRGVQGHAVLLHPFGGGPLVWTVEDGRFVPDAALSVDIELNRVHVEGQPGAVAVVAQRDFEGWTCEGADLVGDYELLAPENDYPVWDGYDLQQDPSALGERPRRSESGTRWLSMQLGEGGTADCVWKTPVRGRAWSVAFAAFAVFLAGLWRRR